MRTTTVIVFSSILGVFVGFGIAKSALTFNAWDQQFETKKYEDNENAKAEVAEVLYDFGVKDVKEKGEYDFKVSNIGTTPLTLEVNLLTCSCTGIEPQRQTVAPGKTGTLTLKWDAERATGFFKQGGTVVTNDQSQPEIRFEVQGIFTAPVMLSTSVVTFPNVVPGRVVSSKIRIYSFEKGPLEILSTEWSNKEHIEFKVVPSELNETEKENDLYSNAKSVLEGVVTINPGLPIGTFQEKFILRTNSVAEPQIEFLVRGQVCSDGITFTGMGYTRETGTIQLGKTSSVQRLAKDMTITFSGPVASQADLKIKDVKPDWLKTTLSEPREFGAESSRKRIYALTIEVPAGSPACNYFKADEESAAMIVLETGLTETPTLKIPVQFAVEQ